MAKIAAEPMELVKFRITPKIIRGVEALAAQRGEDMADMWREVCRFGELIAAIRTAPDPQSGLYGTRTAQALAAELRSIAVDALDFVERYGGNGGSAPVPASSSPPAMVRGETAAARNGNRHSERQQHRDRADTNVALHASIADDLDGLGFGG